MYIERLEVDGIKCLERYCDGGCPERIVMRYPKHEHNDKSCAVSYHDYDFLVSKDAVVELIFEPIIEDPNPPLVKPISTMAITPPTVITDFDDTTDLAVFQPCIDAVHDTWQENLKLWSGEEISPSKPDTEENLSLVKSLSTMAAFPHIGSGGR